RDHGGHHHDRDPRAPDRRAVPVALLAAVSVHGARVAVSAIAAREISMEFQTRRGRVHAIDRVSVEIPDAHFACIVGASGCGKSTLLNVMGGLVRPTSGSVYVDDRPIYGPGTDRGMVFQSYTLFPWLRVRENVEFGPKLK